MEKILCLDKNNDACFNFVIFRNILNFAILRGDGGGKFLLKLYDDDDKNGYFDIVLELFLY